MTHSFNDVITPENLILLSGIDHSASYIPGIITTTSVALPNLMGFTLVSWKIDEPLWIIATTKRALLVPDDHEAVDGRYSFSENAHSWQWGLEVFMGADRETDAQKLVKRIERLTAEFGVEVNAMSGMIRQRAA